MPLTPWLRLHDRLARRLAAVAQSGARAVLACARGGSEAPEPSASQSIEPLGTWRAGGYALAIEDSASPAPDALRAAFTSDAGERPGLGLARYPEHAGDPAELIMAADRAAREATPGTLREAQRRVSARRPAAEPLALAEGRLTLHYQPQVSLTDGSIRGLEALVRIHHKDEEGEAAWVSGGTTAIEHFQEIVPWSFAQARTDLAAWRAAGLPSVPVAVNLPLACLNEQSFCARIAAEFAAHPDMVRDFEIELTEDQPPGDLAQVCDELRQLNEVGLRLALDDVGSGFAGVSLLEQLPLDTLKIDKLFVSRLPDDPEAEANVRSLIALGRAHGLRVIGEGVELPEQRDALAALGCDLYQGYGFSAPVSAEAIGRLLRS